jgi:hypothetical protein
MTENMIKKRKKKSRYNFLIDSDIYCEFSSICEEEGLVRGKQVELMMAEFINMKKEGMNKKKSEEKQVIRK